MTKIYLDLDGVFADFDAAVIGIQKEPKSVFWKKVQDVPEFFYSLKPMPSAKIMFDIIYDYTLIHNIPVEILTALPRRTKHLVTAAHDKERWVAKHLSDKVVVNCADGWYNKTKWVAKDHILLDDTARNIDAWCNEGGMGIHHAGDWNDTLDALEQCVKVAESKKLFT